MTTTSSPVLITLTDRDRAELESWARACKAPLRQVQRAWIVLAAADGQHNAQIARDLGLHVDTVRTWRGRFAVAAGLAEVRYGAAKGRDGLVIVTTLGTGIGSALVHDGVLVPNSELGHLEIDGHDAESRAANSAREREKLSMAEWAGRLTTYYRTLERLLSPDLFVVGGGISKEADDFLPLIDIETEIVPATLLNKAGIVGAALYASENAD